MERKKQAGLLKISPQKTRIVSSKVWLLHKEKRSAIDLLFTDLCSSASTGKGQRQMVPYMAGNTTPCPLPGHRFSSRGLDLTLFSHVLLSQSRTHPFNTCLPTLTTTHSSHQDSTLPQLHLLSFPASYHTHPITPYWDAHPSPTKACYSLSFPWFCGELQQCLSHLKLGNPLCLLFCLSCQV